MSGFDDRYRPRPDASGFFIDTGFEPGIAHKAAREGDREGLRLRPRGCEREGGELSGSGLCGRLEANAGTAVRGGLNAAGRKRCQFGAAGFSAIHAAHQFPQRVDVEKAQQLSDPFALLVARREAHTCAGDPKRAALVSEEIAPAADGQGLPARRDDVGHRPGPGDYHDPRAAAVRCRVRDGGVVHQPQRRRREPRRGAGNRAFVSADSGDDRVEADV